MGHWLAVFFCLLVSLSLSVSDEWPQWRGPDRDGVWRETGILERFETSTLTPKWQTEISAGYSGPTVAGGRVYVSDRLELPEEVERILCFDWKNGQKIWEHQYPASYQGVNYPAGPRAAVTVHQGFAYALGATGRLSCLDAESGDLKWDVDGQSAYRVRMPVWGLTASPLVEGDNVIVVMGGKNACVLAFNRKTGAESWSALEDRANYSAPIVIDQAGQRVVVVWTGERVVGLNAGSGAVVWAYDWRAKRMPLGVATPVLHQDFLFFTGFYDGATLLQLNREKETVSKVWQRQGRSERSTEAIHSIISTLLIKEDFIFGVDSYGELRCLELGTGDRVWEDQRAVPRARWATIHFVEHGERVWMFNEKGDLTIAKLSGEGYEAVSSAHLIDPTPKQLRQRLVVWAHPAFAYRHVFARNDEKLICVDLSASNEL